MTTYHKVQVEDCKVFYREAGSKDKPAILLLHGFFPGFGQNDPSFIPAGADAFKRDVPNAEIHFGK